MEIKFKKVHTAKDLVISAIVLAAGIGLYFVNVGLGGVVAFCGLLMLLLFKSGNKREGEDAVLQKKAIDVAHSCRSRLLPSWRRLGRFGRHCPLVWRYDGTLLSSWQQD